MAISYKHAFLLKIWSASVCLHMKHNVYPWTLEYNHFLLIHTAMGEKIYKKNGAYWILQTLSQFGTSRFKHNFLAKSEGISSPTIQINFILNLFTSMMLKKCYGCELWECGANKKCTLSVFFWVSSNSAGIRGAVGYRSCNVACIRREVGIPCIREERLWVGWMKKMQVNTNITITTTSIVLSITIISI